MGTFFVLLGSLCVLLSAVQSITVFAGPAHNMAQLTLRTWQQLLQDVHSVAQINVKLRDKRQAVMIKKLQRADTVCSQGPRKSRGTCKFLLVFVPGGPPHRVRPCSLHGYRRRKISFLWLVHQASRRVTSPCWAGRLRNKNPSVTQQRMYPLIKLHFLSP